MPSQSHCAVSVRDLKNQVFRHRKCGPLKFKTSVLSTRGQFNQLGRIDGCLFYYGSVYPVAKIADCNSVTLETSLVRLQPGSPKIVRLFPTPLYKGSCAGKQGYCAALLKWLKRTVLKTVRSVNPMPEFESLRPRQSFSRRAYIIPVPYHRLKGRIYCVFVAKLVRHSTFNRGIAEFKSRRIHQLCAYRLMPKTVSSKLTYLCWIRSGRAKAN